jgi:cytochrome b561
MSYGSLPAAKGYSGTAKFLHWVIALCVLTIIPVGIAMNQEGPYQNQLFNLHKSLGVLILFLMILRIAYRVTAGAPAAEPGLARWQKAVSSSVHGLLYILLIVLPIAGYIANSAYGESGTPTPFFGLFSLPPIVGPNEALSTQIFTVHRYVGFFVGVLVVMHIGAALQHYFIIKDGVLQRMLPKALGGR